jgi:adenosine 3'-phospho 5'-phosphosulfate transporter B3
MLLMSLMFGVRETVHAQGVRAADTLRTPHARLHATPQLYMTAAELYTKGRWPLRSAVLELRRLAASRSALRGLGIVFGTYTLSTSLSKVSLAYISVPLQVVVKSSKIIPVMLGGRFITGKRYSYAEYAGAVLLASGVALFSGAGGNLSAAVARDASGGADALTIGIGLLAITLCADALLGNWQERTMKDAGITPSQMMLLQALFAAGLSGVAAAATGELAGGMLLLHAPGGARLLWLLVCYASVMLLGTTAILTLVEEHGAAAAVLVTLIRKCSSMFFSFVLWPKPVGVRHIAGALLVFAAPFAAQRAAKKGSSAASKDAAHDAEEKV